MDRDAGLQGCGWRRRRRHVRMALPGIFLPDENGRPGKHGPVSWKRRPEICSWLCPGGSAAYHTFRSFRYCSQYGLYRSSAEVLYPDRCRNLQQRQNLHAHHLRTDFIFLSFSGADRTFHSPGRFQNTAESQLFRSGSEHDP